MNRNYSLSPAFRRVATTSRFATTMTLGTLLNGWPITCATVSVFPPLRLLSVQQKCFSTPEVTICTAVADLHTKNLDATPPSPIFFIFMQFLVKFGQIIGWHLPLRNPHLGNPGSAAGKRIQMLNSFSIGSKISLDSREGQKCIPVGCVPPTH